MTLRSRMFIAVVTLLVVIAPLIVQAFPIGGQASVVLPCIHNSTIYTRLGPPRGGTYVWTVATETYNFGPPRHAGQWVLGLAGAPYYCFYSVRPIITWSAIIITMMGSSQ